MRNSSGHSGGGPEVAVMLVATILVVASSIPAQVPDGGIRAFFEPLEVPLVNIDALVTDADGRPVPGLTLADFEVLEDGRPVEVTHFAAVSPPWGTDPGLAKNSEPTALSEQELTFVVFVDESALSPREVRTAIDRLHSILDVEPVATLRLMLVTSEGRATVRVPLTDDPSRLVSVLDEMARDARPRLDSERDRILRDLSRTAGALGSAAARQSLAAGPGIDPLTGERRAGGEQTPEEGVFDELAYEARRWVPVIRAHAAEQRRRTEHLFSELEMLVRSLSVVRGRKAILLVCGALEARPGEGLFLAWEQAFPEIARQINVNIADEARANDLGPMFKHLTGTANRHRVSFYTLSPALRFASGSTAETPGFSEGRNLDQAMVGQNSLSTIARATGGRTLVSTAGRADRLNDVVREMESFYSLGYSPDHPADGKHHALTVRVRRESLDVRHREGYLHSPSTDRIIDRTLAAAMHGVTDNPLGVLVEAQEVGPAQADSSYLVPVVVRVPFARLMLRPEGDQQIGQITVLVMVRNARGLSDLQSWRYPINVTNDRMMEALGSYASVVLNLAVGEDTQWIAVGVRDDVAGSEATATLEVDLPPPSVAGVPDE